MNLFHVIDDGCAILRLRGRRYRQCKVFSRGEQVYAGVGSDFVRLLAHGGTSDPTISWQDLEAPGVTLGANRLPTFEGAV